MMTEVHRLTLEEEHLAAGATMSSVRGWSLPIRFSNSSAEYHAADESAVLMDAGFLTIVSATGSDHLEYLNRRLTQKVIDQAVGEVRRATLLGGDGKMLADMQVLRAAENRTLLVAPPTLAGSDMEQLLSKYVFHEDAKFQNETSRCAVFCILGPQKTDVLDAAGFGMPPANPALSFSCESLCGGTVVLVDRENAEATYHTLLEKVLERRGARLGFEAFEVLRIEAGAAWFGVELDSETYPVEAGLMSAIHQDKGCYPGQEIIARMLNLGHPARKLVGMAFDGADVPHAGFLVTEEGRPAGELRSCCHSPSRGSIGLAMVKWSYRQRGMRLVLRDSQIAGVVADLPFAP